MLLPSNNIRSPWKFWKESVGIWALASFLICVFSGVILAVPYDVRNAYASINSLIITNPPAAFFRNIHYWSAQFFLVFSLIHLLDYFLLSVEHALKYGVWVRLVLSIPVMFFVMLSGFILKGDAESLQAHRILTALLKVLPWTGDALNTFFLGTEDNLQIIYVHHIATSTLFLIIIIVEHSRRIWASWFSVVISLLLISALSLGFSAPLHDNLHPLVKGPWYFLGLQEILHWMQNGFWVWIFALAVLSGFIFLPKLKLPYQFWVRKSMVILGFIFLLLTVFAFFFRGESWAFRFPWERQQVRQAIFPFNFAGLGWHYADSLSILQISVGGDTRHESCMACHGGMTGFSPSHDPKAIGCYICHRGNPFTLNKTASHKNMLRVPGNLENAGLSCGSSGCHPEINERLRRSIMTTLSGIVTIDRFVFGESASLNSLAHISDLGQSAADNHLRDLCASCHLGHKKLQPGPVGEVATGRGCNACHLSYDAEATKAFIIRQTHPRKDTALPTIHPRLDLKISNTRCFGCHSRSGRISPSYEGWHETTLSAEDALGNPSLRILEDKRVFTFVSADIHQSKGLQCIDCHISWELMGDGNYYAHKEDQIRVACSDCHFEKTAAPILWSVNDDDARRILNLQGTIPANTKTLKTQKGGYALWNTKKDDNGLPVLVGKLSGKTHPLRPPGKNCQQGTVHKKVSCIVCHTAWTPSCIGCHNTYDRKAKGYDLLAQKEVSGAWTEYVGLMLADIPTIGVRLDSKGKQEYVACAPGMILTIDRGSYQGKPGKDLVFMRLFAAVNPHTIQSRGRDCIDCHCNPLALGFGQGELNYEIKQGKGRWVFQPRFALRKEDMLPEDAWTGFLDGRYGKATRDNIRSLHKEEQERMLFVGACLQCHDPKSAIINKTLQDYEDILKNLPGACILPQYRK